MERFSLDDAFGLLVSELVTRDGVEPELLAPDAFIARVPGSLHRVAVVRDGPEAMLCVAELMSRGPQNGGIEIAVVGGPASRAERLKGAVESFAGTGLWVAHLADGGACWYPEGASVGTGFLRDHLQHRPAAKPNPRQFWKRLQAAERANREAFAFAGAVATRRPLGTMALLVLCAIVYAMELRWNATHYTPAIVRMGALSREGVEQGEVWRLLSCTLLHGSHTHIALNALALWLLGPTLEVVLGTARFLVLYTAAALGGSLLSLATLGDGYSVGASGAIWGLMAALFVLAWRGKGILPTAYRDRLRSAFGKTLLLNVLVSMLPGVDYGAHAGGGIAGALLMGTGLLTLGLPRWAEAPPGQAPPPDRVPRWAQVAGALGGALLVAALGAALWAGRPWTLDAAPRMERVPVGSTGYTVELPQGLGLERVADDVAYVAGDLRHDGVLIELFVFPGEIPEGDIAPSYDWLAAESAKDDGSGLAITLHQNAEGLLVGTRTMPSGVVQERSAAVTTGGMFRVDVLRLGDTPEPWHGLAAHILKSLRK